MKLTHKTFLGVLLLALISLAFAINVYAQSPRVIAILFYSPTCPHCHIVLDEVLPPIQANYGDQLKIYTINISLPEGQELYQSAVEHYQIPVERMGVPALIVGETVLVGSREIPHQFPGLIDDGLAANGFDLPNIPGLNDENLEVFVTSPTSAIEEVVDPLPTSTSSESQNQQQPSLKRSYFLAKFLQDPSGNTLAVIVLLGILVSIIWVVWIFLNNSGVKNTRWSLWAIPVLALAGLGVAGYLSYIETTHTEAVCGPIGNCNAVQQSPYAYVLGTIPVGVLGFLGYLLILAAWGIYWLGSAKWKKIAILFSWGLVWFGVIFSLYLTFLEPFVIGATCAWCISSAIIMTCLLLATTGPAINAWNSEG